jgi:hypothetical protein
MVVNPEVKRRSLACVAPEHAPLVDDVGVVVEQLARSQGVTAIGCGEKLFQGGGRRSGMGAGAMPGELALELGPPGEPVFQRQRVLNIAKTGTGGRAGIDALQPVARGGLVRSNGPEPPLGFPPEILEGALGRECPAHHTFLHSPEVR